MTALADSLRRSTAGCRARTWGAGTVPAAVSGPVVAADQSGAVRDQARTVRSWPLLLLALPAAAEAWSGWVGIAQKTGFGRVSLLPGIWPSLHLDTSISLPVGVEAYAAYALRAWLATDPWISPRTRRFAKWSAICSFALGMAARSPTTSWSRRRVPGAVGHHHRGVLHACPGPGHGDRAGPPAARRRLSRGHPDSRTAGPAGARSPGWSAEDQPAVQPDQDNGTRTTGRTRPRARTSSPPRHPARQHHPAPPGL